MASPDEVSEEYRIAYQALKHLDKQMSEFEERMQRDWDLAYKRWNLARSAYLELALGEDDKFLQEGE